MASLGRCPRHRRVRASPAPAIDERTCAWRMSRHPRAAGRHQGLYDGQHEHDACGVAFVATLSGQADPRDRRPGAHRAAQPRPPRRLGRRARLGRRCGHPHPDPRRAAAGDRAVHVARQGRLRGRVRLPARRRRRGRRGAGRRRAHRRRGGPHGRRLARRAGRPQPAGCHRPSGDAALPAGRRRPARPAAWSAWPWSGWPTACASAPSTRPTSTSRRCRRGRSSTRGCSRRLSSSRSSLTSPTAATSPSWRSCTRASRPTPSRRGRSPTPTG